MTSLDVVLLDLDDTLLANNMDTFVPAYLELIDQVVQREFPEPDFQKVLIKSTRAMFESQDETTTNRDVFWSTFRSLSSINPVKLETSLARFYEEEFPALKTHTRPASGAQQIVAHLQEKGLKLVLATNPIFPKSAIVERLRWAELDESSFDVITSYETSCATKPHPAYYRQILSDLGCSPQRALMVGNDPAQDTRPATALGLHTYLVEDASKTHGSTVAPSDPVARSFSTDVETNPDDERGNLETLLKKLLSGWPG
jgi:HAD superfamily hydrolase (TIGR01509 family)